MVLAVLQALLAQQALQVQLVILALPDRPDLRDQQAQILTFRGQQVQQVLQARRVILVWMALPDPLALQVKQVALVLSDPPDPQGRLEQIPLFRGLLVQQDRPAILAWTAQQVLRAQLALQDWMAPRAPQVIRVPKVLLAQLVRQVIKAFLALLVLLVRLALKVPMVLRAQLGPQELQV